MSSHADSTRARYQWMEKLVASDLPLAVKVVGIKIALHLRVKTGRCDPSFSYLAAGTGFSERSIYRLVPLLERKGWITVQRTRGRQSNYALVTPDSTMAKTTDTIMSGGTPDKSSVADDLTPDKLSPDPCQCHNSPLTNTSKTPDRAESGNHRNSSKIGTIKRTESKSLGASPLGPTIDLFDRFWSAYPKRVAKEAARKAFARAVETGTDPEAVIAGAKRYAGDRAGQDPKYTAHPATFINGRRWEDEAPGQVVDQHGNVVAYRPRPGPNMTGII